MKCDKCENEAFDYCTYLGRDFRVVLQCTCPQHASPNCLSWDEQTEERLTLQETLEILR
jgi:hypothetical protein